MAAPINGQVVLFEHANFHGRQKFIFHSNDILNQTDLNAGDDNSFDRATSSLVVISGQWQFFDENGGLLGPVTLLPGAYPFVGNVGIPNDAIRFVRWISP
jgi:Beta/Gamma crystallin